MDFFDSDKLRETFWIVNVRLSKRFSAWCYQLGWSRDTIQDWVEHVTADGIMAAQETLEEWDQERGNFHTWVALKAEHIGRKRLMKENRRAGLVDDLIALSPVMTTDPIDENLNHQELVAVLHALRNAECEALSLHYLWGLEVKQVARIMDCPIKTVYTLLDRGRKSALAEFEKIRRAELKLEKTNHDRKDLSPRKEKGEELKDIRPPPSQKKRAIG